MLLHFGNSDLCKSCNSIRFFCTFLNLVLSESSMAALSLGSLGIFTIFGSSGIFRVAVFCVSPNSCVFG